MTSLKKVLRFIGIYGVRRTMIKAAGRSRNLLFKLFFPELLTVRERYVSLIGCGQFGYATISYFILRRKGKVFLDCYDTDEETMETASAFYGYKKRIDADEVFRNTRCRLLYIASNHASHTAYAVEAMTKGLEVYVEKPISVTWDQFKLLLITKEKTGKTVYAGYNRPFSKAINILDSKIKANKMPLTLNCTVFGHKLSADHWYRNEEEGTRICGNLGHWLDLTVHLMNGRGNIPDDFRIAVSCSNERERDDNLSITIVTEANDLVNIVLTSRSEPFEGIIEEISFQSGTLSACIHDFREMDLWDGDMRRRYSFFPKDVGHKEAIGQPWNQQKRDFYEVEISTILMLSITDMVRMGEVNRTINPAVILRSLKEA